MGGRALQQGTFPTQGSNPRLLHCRQVLCHLSPPGKPPALFESASVGKVHMLILSEFKNRQSLARRTWPSPIDASYRCVTLFEVPATSSSDVSEWLSAFQLWLSQPTSGVLVCWTSCRPLYAVGEKVDLTLESQV